MQNRYTGDIGDFAKFGLLRFLSGMTDVERPEPRLRVGLNWYLVPDERHGGDRRRINNDGRFVEYLVPSEENIGLYGECDPELWAKLGQLVGMGARCVHCTRVNGVLPDDAKFYEVMLRYLPNLPVETKTDIREHWFQHALRKTRNTELVCCDPDNGIGLDRDMYDAERGPKYAYMPDLRAIWERQQSLVIYQHIDRSEAAMRQIEDRAAILGTELGQEPIPLRWRRWSSRVFFVVPQPRHRRVIEERVGRFLDHGWGQHFERVA